MAAVLVEIERALLYNIADVTLLALGHSGGLAAVRRQTGM